MKYINSFQKFRLLLEKINKDRDYYTARLEDLDKTVLMILSKLIEISQNLEKSGGVNISYLRVDVFSKIKQAFIDSLKETYTLDYSDEDEIEKVIDKIINFEEEFSDSKSQGVVSIKIFKEPHIKFNSRKNKKGENIYTSLVFIIQKGMFVNYGKSINLDKNFEKNISKEDLQNLKLELTKIVDKMSEVSLSVLSSDSPEKIAKIKKLLADGKKVDEIVYETGIKREKIIKIQISDLLNSGKNVKEIKKITKLSEEEIKQFLSQIQSQKESEEEVDYSSPEYKKTEPNFADPLAKKITDWEKVIEDFRNFGKRYFTKKEFFIEFDIELDKFKDFLTKTGYEMKIKELDTKRNYIESICKPIINSFVNKMKKGKKSNLDKFHSSFYFMKICSHSAYGVLSVDNRVSEYSETWENIIVNDQTIIPNNFKLKEVNKPATVTGFTAIWKDGPSPTNPIFVEKEEDIKYESGAGVSDITFQNPVARN